MAYKRLLTGLFICLFSFLLMSHNTYAALSIPVKLVNGNYDGSLLMGGSTNPNCVYVPSNHSFAQNSCTDVDIIAQNFQVTFNTGTYLNTYIVDIPLYFTLNTNNNALDAWLRNLTLSSSDNNHWSIIDVDFQMLTTSSGLAHIYLKSYGAAHTDNTVQFTSNNNYILSLHPSEVIGIGNTTVWEIIDTTVDTQSIVDAIEDIAPAPSAQDIADAITQDEEDATQDAADASTSAGSSAASDSEQATSSLLSTITGFFNAIIGVNPSNCKFNSNLPFLPGNGEIDLCSIDTPPIVQTLSSLVLVGLFIPFCIHMFNRFVSITESFQR